MKFQEVKKLARSMDINTHRMKKAAIVLATAGLYLLVVVRRRRRAP